MTPGDLNAMRANTIDKDIGIACHHALARPLADAWPEHQARHGDLLGLGLNGVDDAIGDNVPARLQRRICGAGTRGRQRLRAVDRRQPRRHPMRASRTHCGPRQLRPVRESVPATASRSLSLPLCESEGARCIRAGAVGWPGTRRIGARIHRGRTSRAGTAAKDIARSACCRIIWRRGFRASWWRLSRWCSPSPRRAAWTRRTPRSWPPPCQAPSPGFASLARLGTTGVAGTPKGWILVGAAANGCNGRDSRRSDSRAGRRRDPASCRRCPAAPGARFRLTPVARVSLPNVCRDEPDRRCACSRRAVETCERSRSSL